MIKLVVTDLDNTLLRRDKTISDYTVSVFEHCRERGILIAFATARSEQASRRFTAQIAPDIFISNGGALARRGAETLSVAPIRAETVSALIRDCLGTPEVDDITLMSSSGYYNSKPIDTNWAGWVDYSDSIHTDFTETIDFSDVYKITVNFTSADAAYSLAERYPDVDIIGYTGESWYMFKAHEASKENAVRTIAEHLSIPLTDIAAFGDDYNDVELLRSVGCGVAVANAIPECKDAAAWCCGDCDDDGVARWLEQNILA